MNAGKPTDTAKVLAQEGAKKPSKAQSLPAGRSRATGYVPLSIHSVYSFLNSTLTIDAIVALAKQHGQTSIALADTGNLHGAVEFTQAAKRAGIKPILGATVLVEGQPTRLYVQNATGYHSLCRLLSTTARHADSEDEPTELRQVRIGMQGLNKSNEGLLAVGADTRLSAIFGDRFYRAIADADEAKASSALPRIALLPVHYAERNDRWKWNIVQSIRTRTLLRQAHPAKILDVDIHLRSAAEMTNLFRDYPDALSNTFELAERCSLSCPWVADALDRVMDANEKRSDFGKMAQRALVGAVSGYVGEKLPTLLPPTADDGKGALGNPGSKRSSS